MEIKPIAYIKNGFTDKFGIPRQSGMANTVESRVIFCPEYRDENAIRGIEQYSHLWLIWGFSENEGQWSPTVRPPRLGGNERVGVFATRSPFRPNSMGLSCVKLERVEDSCDGKVLVVTGADIKNETPVYDIKPYLPYVDSVADAMGGFSDKHKNDRVQVVFACSTEELSEAVKCQLTELLSYDPRPSYQDDSDRVYGLDFSGYRVKFTCDGRIITVTEVTNDIR
ncbi:MAG: tRNA (N6-threonylcarbamoyladenosine(37)-N6)-methyltransferase TrmO [Clostridia bacterium]|nr:tRNA (N6-threonylcarbamoyladenosine(37)-N6)-methyltransferase TrmO [Clostridia bacterium]